MTRLEIVLAAQAFAFQTEQDVYADPAPLVLGTHREVWNAACACAREVNLELAKEQRHD